MLIASFLNLYNRYIYPRKDKVINSIWYCALLMVTLSVISEVYKGSYHWANKTNIEARSLKAATDDVDNLLFINNIRMHPSFQSTLIWWHGNWIGKSYPYYWRPLTMLSYWAEYHLFKPFRFDRWQMALFLFHFIFTVVLGLLSYSLTKSRAAALFTALLFNCCHNIPVISDIIPIFTRFTTQSALVVLNNWKDQPEAWVGIFTLATVIFTLRKQWWPALICASIAVCYKESGWQAFAFAFVTLLYTKQLTKLPFKIYIGAAISISMLIALRASAGHNVFIGPREGGHEYIPLRFYVGLTDENLVKLTTDYWPIPICGFAIAAITLIRKLKFVLKFVAVILVCWLSAICIGNSQHDNSIAITMFIMDGIGKFTLIIAIFFAYVFIFTCKDKETLRTAIYLYILVVIATLPVIAIRQPNDHMLYMNHALKTLLIVYMTTAAFRYIYRTNRAQLLEYLRMPLIKTTASSR